MSERKAKTVVGLAPWLPWPLSAWGWWTEPVRAERLAALRIGMAACLVIDLLTTYRAHLEDYFGTGGLGGRALFAYFGAAPRLNWSILRGLGDPLLGTLALGAWLVLTVGLAGKLWERRKLRSLTLPARQGVVGRGVAVWILLWLGAGAVVGLGIWARTLREAGESLPAVLASWQDDPGLLWGAFWLWLAAAALLLVGWYTRLAAIVTWALSVSFATANPNIDNAGDMIRGITLFYLMLCPCGAAWSVDRLLKWGRLSTGPYTSRLETGSTRIGPAYVWPWALRLLFVQLVLIYFMNGLYKLTGTSWLTGGSLYYVLCDLTLTRLSFAQAPLPLLVTQAATWLVLAWELSFPVLVLLRWTRPWALLFGVLFHLGILATMELGGFAPYILCLYLPLVRGEGRGDRRQETGDRR